MIVLVSCDIDSGAAMAEEGSIAKIEANEEGWPIFELWQKYEDIAMHFNDLLIKLRTQALGAVAALSTIVGIFAKAGANELTSWILVAFAFLVLTVFWVAIWMIDFLYYNRLLLGAVIALVELEKRSMTEMRVRPIQMSMHIENAVAGPHLGIRPTVYDGHRLFCLQRGRWFFYLAVFAALATGSLFATYKTWTTPPIH